MPVVTLLGPRQSGKTTLARAVFPSHTYVSLERPDESARAHADPVGFLAAFKGGPVILDEVQRAPNLLSYIQDAVDRDPTAAGRFILTGSQNLLLMEKVTQTLAGRTAILNLHPLSLAELRRSPGFDPECLDQLPPLNTTNVESAAPALDLWSTLWAGFYPRIHDRDLDASFWLADYRRTYVERDIRQVLKVMDTDAFDRFLVLAAARTGQELKFADLAADAGISQPTAKQWIAALRVGFLITLLPPHHQNFRKRMRKHAKLHFLDTGLCCHLLGIRDAATLAAHPLRGAIFESFVVSELVKAFANQGREAPLYFWRDSTGHELDVVVDLGTRLLPIEAKSGLTVGADAVDGLRYWTSLTGNPNRGGCLVHGGDRPYSLHGFAVRPWTIA